MLKSGMATNTMSPSVKRSRQPGFSSWRENAMCSETTGTTASTSESSASNHAAPPTSNPFSEAMANSEDRTKFFSTSKDTLTVQPEGISSRKCRYVGVRCPCVGIIPRPKRCSASIPRNSSEAPSTDQVTRRLCHKGRMKKGNWSMKRTLLDLPGLVKRKRYRPWVRSLCPSLLKISRITTNLSSIVSSRAGTGCGKKTSLLQIGIMEVANKLASNTDTVWLSVTLCSPLRGTDTRTVELSAAVQGWKEDMANHAERPSSLGVTCNTTSKAARSSTVRLSGFRTTVRDIETKGDSAMRTGPSKVVRPRRRPHGSNFSHGVKFSVHTGS
mmetsp:Transcript_27467/g.72317  ORF Transcript_27467/g.72317 Transcript_27467/m.72317 type:complete len:328 (+) Transcript_27467:336-1319(+)